MKTVLVIIALQFLPTTGPSVQPYDVRQVEKRIEFESKEDCEGIRRQYSYTGIGHSYMIVGSYCIEE